MMYVPCRIMSFRSENRQISAVSVFKKSINGNFVLVMENDTEKKQLRNNSTVMQFLCCKMYEIPRANIIRLHLPNLRILRIVNTPIKSINRDDLDGYECLRDLEIVGTNINYLPGDLFDHTPLLEVMNFKRNKIKFIEERIIAALIHMKYIDLTHNININVKFDRIHSTDSVDKNCVSFGELESAIIFRCKPPLKISPPGTFKYLSPSSPTNAFDESSEVFNDFNYPEEEIVPSTLDTKYEELKDKIESEMKLRRGQKLEISSINQKLEELKKNIHLSNVESNKEHSETKEFIDSQSNINKDVERQIEDIFKDMAEINDKFDNSEKKFTELNENFKAFKKTNEAAIEKLKNNVEDLTKTRADHQKDIDELKNASELQKKDVKGLVKVIYSENKKKLSDHDSKLRKEIAETSKKCEKQRTDLNLVIQSHVAVLKADLEKKIEEIPSKRQRFDDEYTIIIGKEEFKIHKSFLLAHSPKIATMVREKPETESFELKEEEISVESFKEILNFMYLGVAPNPQSNLVSLYAASCHLEINTLATIVAGMLKDKINPDNAFEILIYCNEYGKDELKMKAFEEFSKNFPKQKLNPELASRPQVLAKLNETKMEVDNILGTELI